jgi:hypothetical protein
LLLVFFAWGGLLFVFVLCVGVHFAYILIHKDDIRGTEVASLGSWWWMTYSALLYTQQRCDVANATYN